MLMACAALALGAALGNPAPAQAQGQTTFRPTEETVENLPDGQGREETFYACTACHGLALITAQGMTARQWDDTIQFMIERHNMPPPDAKDRELIVQYLASRFPPRVPQGRPWQNPFLRR